MAEVLEIYAHEICDGDMVERVPVHVDQLVGRRVENPILAKQVGGDSVVVILSYWDGLEKYSAWLPSQLRVWVERGAGS